jgi:hypothetical protein
MSGAASGGSCAADSAVAADGKSGDRKPNAMVSPTRREFVGHYGILSLIQTIVRNSCRQTTLVLVFLTIK